MLENNETIEGVDQSVVLARMLQELPWANLRAYVQANSQLLKSCTIGGHRLDAKRRKRIEKMVMREAEKADFVASACSGVFAVWYPVHEELHKALEDYFHSDEYKEYREENDLAEDDYVLSDEMFDKFFSIEDLEKWRVLLCFSPLKFTQKQADKILENSQGNVQLLETISELEKKVTTLEKRASQLETENERLRESERQNSSGAQEAKKTSRNLRTENEALSKKLEVSLVEARKLCQKLDETGTARKEIEAKVRKEFRKDEARIKSDLTRLETELAEWIAKYEKQRVKHRELEEEMATAAKQLLNEKQHCEELVDENNYLNAFGDLILQHIDWAKVGGQMKLTVAMRRQFNSLVRKLNYEDDQTLTIEGTLPDFWNGLLALEKELVQSIAVSNTQEVMAGNVENYWLDLADAFGDVKISLEARLILLNMLQEIFYQVIEMGDLEAPEIPILRRRKK